MSPFVKKYKVIPHPGEVNKIREVPDMPHVVVTHTDAPELYVWNVERHPAEAALGAEPNPDLVLIGHKENAEFALGMSRQGHCVASGGQDKMVLLWSLADYATSLSSLTAHSSEGNKKAPKLEPRFKFQGHKDTIEDVKINPFSEFELCSVGDDKTLLFWDSRTGSAPVLKVLKAHNNDVHCCDWSPFEEHLIVTGSADKNLKLFDRRKLSMTTSGTAAVHSFENHEAPITTVEWSPHAKGICVELGGREGEYLGLLQVWGAAVGGRAQVRPAGAHVPARRPPLSGG